jgi:Ca2+-binding EF-hand superfamily protein
MTNPRPLAIAACAALASSLCLSLPAAAQDKAPGGKEQKEQKAPAAAGGSAAARSGVPLQQNQTRQQLFDKTDANSNGTISRAEAQTVPALMVIFVEMDANGDGELSSSEFANVPLSNPDGSAAR